MPDLPTNQRLLLALQFWDGDSERAGQLADFLCAQEPSPQWRADLLFFARSDAAKPAWTDHPHPNFQTYFARSARVGTGWPDGPNQLWFGLIEYLRSACRDGRMPRYSGIFTLEPDCIPIRQDWVHLLFQEWHKRGVDFLGAAMNGPDLAVAPHTNGNMIVRGSDEVLSAVAEQAAECPKDQAWDVWLYPFLARNFRVSGSDLIFNCWQSPTIAAAAVYHWRRQGIALIHGVRDDSCLRHAREQLPPLTPRET